MCIPASVVWKTTCASHARKLLNWFDDWPRQLVLIVCPATTYWSRTCSPLWSGHLVWPCLKPARCCVGIGKLPNIVYIHTWWGGEYLKYSCMEWDGMNGLLTKPWWTCKVCIDGHSKYRNAWWHGRPSSGDQNVDTTHVFLFGYSWQNQINTSAIWWIEVKLDIFEASGHLSVVSHWSFLRSKILEASSRDLPFVSGNKKYTIPKNQNKQPI